MLIVVVLLGKEKVWFAGTVNDAVGSVVMITPPKVVRSGSTTVPPSVMVSEESAEPMNIVRSARLTKLLEPVDSI